MDSIYILIPIALLFVVIAVKAFFWAIDSKQFDDLDSVGKSILFDDDPVQSNTPSPEKSDDKNNSMNNKNND